MPAKTSSLHCSRKEISIVKSHACGFSMESRMVTFCATSPYISFTVHAMTFSKRNLNILMPLFELIH